MAQMTGDNENNPLWLLVPLVIAAVVIYIGIRNNGQIIGLGMLWVSKVEITAFSWFFADAKMIVDRLDQFIASWQYNPNADRPFGVPLAALEVAGNWLRLPVMALLSYILYLTFKVKIDVSERFTRVFDLNSLLKRNAKLYPVIRPAVDSDVGNKPLDTGEWRMARQPFQYCLEGSLFIEGDMERAKKMIDLVTGLPDVDKQEPHHFLTVDTQKCEAKLVEQLGVQFLADGDNYLKSCLAMPGIERAILALILSHGCGDKDKARGFINQLSLSWKIIDFTPSDIDGRLKVGLNLASVDNAIRFYLNGEPCPDVRRYEYEAKFKNLIASPDYKKSKKKAGVIATSHAKKMSILKGRKNREKVTNAINSHNSYSWVLLTSLLLWARKEQGALESFMFLWLRPSLRTLWYALNAAGGRMPWAESAGIWAHLEAENVLGVPIYMPEVKMGVKGIIDQLDDEGWVASNEK